MKILWPVMDQVIDLLQTSLQLPQQDFKQTLASFSEHKVFMRKSSKVECVVTQLNSLLNSSDDHAKGVLLLHSYLLQCNPSVFANHGFFWMQQCLKSAVQDEAITILEFLTLSELFKLSADFIDLRKNVINTLLPKFFDKLDGKGSKEVRAAKTKCLISVMSNYGGACGLRRGIIDKFIQKSLKVMSMDDKEWLADTCKCYLLVAQCGGGGSQGFIHKGNWSQQFQILINTAHSLLDSLFDSVTEIQVSKTSSEDGENKKLNFLEATSAFGNSVTRYNTYSSLFCKTMKLLQTMLLGAFPAPKSVMPVVAFNLVCRGLAVNCQTVSKKSPTLDKIALISVIPFIHVELLNTLDALIKCCGRNLIPYASLICKLTCQSLKWTTEEWEYLLEKPFKSVKIATYRVLQSWLNSARLSSCIEFFANDFLELLEKDYKYDKPSVKLQDKNQAGDSKGKRKKQVYAHEDEIERKDFGKSSNLICNKDTCYESLCTLQLILQSASTSLSAAQHRDLQLNIIKLLLDIHQSSSGALPIPYSDPACRLQLYRTLHFLVVESHSDGVPPTSYAARIFTKGLLDTSQPISLFCGEALSSIEKIVHPLCNSLYFPNEAPEETHARESTIQSANLMSVQEELSTSRQSEISESILSRSQDLTGIISSGAETTNFSMLVNVSRGSCSEEAVIDNETNKVALKSNTSLQESCQKLSEKEASKPSGPPKVIIVDNSSSSSSCSVLSVVENPSSKSIAESVCEVEVVSDSSPDKSVPKRQSPELEEIISSEPPLKRHKTKQSESSLEAEANEKTEKLDKLAEIDSNDTECDEMLADFVDMVNDE